MYYFTIRKKKSQKYAVHSADIKRYGIHINKPSYILSQILPDFLKSPSIIEGLGFCSLQSCLHVALESYITLLVDAFAHKRILCP